MSQGSSGQRPEIPKPIDHVVSMHGEPLTVYPNPFADTEVGDSGVAFRNADGAGPYHKVTGCPNCGKHAGWWDQIDHSAALNSGRDPNAPCSRACRYQLEWREELWRSRTRSASPRSKRRATS